MNILFTICGRAGSKGIKNKNMKDFLGFPLPFYTVSVIDMFTKAKSNINCDIVLNTDSRDLIDMFKKRVKLSFYIIERDPILAQDNTPKVAVIDNCRQIMEQRRATYYDMVVDLDITSPLRRLEDLVALIETKAESEVDVVFSVTDSRRNPYFNMVKKTGTGYERVIASDFNTRQEAPEIYDMNASLYAYSPSFLASGKGIFQGRCDVIKMLDTAVLDIDNENDYELMQVVAAYLFDKYPRFREVREHIDLCCK